MSSKSDLKDTKCKTSDKSDDNPAIDFRDDIYLEERIDIPEKWDSYEGFFSWRKLWLFTGPGWLSKMFNPLMIFNDNDFEEKTLFQ